MDQILSDGRNLRVQAADAVSQETRIKSGVPQGSVIGPHLSLLFVNDHPSVISVTTLLFADDVKMVSSRSKSDFLQGFINNVWNWLVNLELPNATLPLLNGLLYLNYPLPLEVRAVLYR